jgi:hypothetical protein
LKVKLIEMFEAGEESSGEDKAGSGQSSDQANAIAPECEGGAQPASLPSKATAISIC